MRKGVKEAYGYSHYGFRILKFQGFKLFKWFYKSFIPVNN